jgi:NAD(P)H-dependent FMN reductase
MRRHPPSFASAMTNTAKFLLVSGSLRERSTNTAVVHTASVVAPAHVEVTVYEDLAGLPHFNPDHDAELLPRAVAELRAQIREADALVFSTPEYAGALPGSFKNLLDWTIGDAEPGSIYEKPVAWINASPHGATQAHASLRTVLGYAHATIVEDACADVPVTSRDLGEDGLVADPQIRARIADVLRRVAAHLSGSDGSDAPGSVAASPPGGTPST